jgi:creatinine amidohydrolase
MLHLRPDLVRFDRAVDDAAARHPFYDVVPPPVDFVPASGTLWKATRAASDKGAFAWPEIVGSLRDALTVDLPAPAQGPRPTTPRCGTEPPRWDAPRPN